MAGVRLVSKPNEATMYVVTHTHADTLDDSEMRVVEERMAEHGMYWWCKKHQRPDCICVREVKRFRVIWHIDTDMLP